MIFLSGIITVFGFFKMKEAFNAFNLLLKIILMSAFVFQLLDDTMSWLNPNRGYYFENGVRFQATDMSGFFIGILSFVIAMFYAFSTTKLKSKQSILPELYLAIATCLGTVILFVIYEVL